MVRPAGEAALGQGSGPVRAAAPDKQARARSGTPAQAEAAEAVEAAGPLCLFRPAPREVTLGLVRLGLGDLRAVEVKHALRGNG